MSDPHLDSSFHNKSMKLDNYVKINEWFDSSLGQSTVIQRLNANRAALSNPDQTQNKRRYITSHTTLKALYALNIDTKKSLDLSECEIQS